MTLGCELLKQSRVISVLSDVFENPFFVLIYAKKIAIIYAITVPVGR